jgi:hypothetical protein
MLSGLRRRMAAANRAATSTQRILLVAPRPRLPVTGDCIESDTSRPITTGPGLLADAAKGPEVWKKVRV